MTDFNARIREEAVVTLAVVDDPADGAPLARALLEGGLASIEVAMRTPQSLEAIAMIAEAEPTITLLAGTVITVEQAKDAVAAGATGLVSPGFSAGISLWCEQQGVPYIPGVATASEIMAALDHGHRLLKFFPAAALGGLDMLSALHAPFAIHETSYLLTGGMTTADLDEALRVPYVAAVGGTWIAPRSLVREHDWQAITQSARASRAAALQARAAGEAA